MGTAVGDSLVDLAREGRRCLGDREPWGRFVSGEAGRLKDLGAKSRVLSVAGGEAERLRGLCWRRSLTSEPVAGTGAFSADSGSAEA